MNAGTEGESGSEQSAAGGTGSPSRRRHAVFISDFVHLESSFDDVVPALLDPDGAWRGVVASSAARQRFEVIFGESRQKDLSVIIPVRWEPTTFERLLPVLDADIELLSLGSGHSRLSMSGRYQVPLAQLGATLDRLAMHRVAESAVRRFLAEIAETLPMG